jgi:hypothetical protein
MRVQPREETLMEIPPALMIIGGIFVIVVAVLWLLLPFAVFGVKERLDKIITGQKRVATLLDKQIKMAKGEDSPEEEEQTSDRSTITELPNGMFAVGRRVSDQAGRPFKSRKSAEDYVDFAKSRRGEES